MYFLKYNRATTSGIMYLIAICVVTGTKLFKLSNCLLKDKAKQNSSVKFENENDADDGTRTRNPSITNRAL